MPRLRRAAHIVVAWIITVRTLLYTLPWAIAATRNKPNTTAIALINVLLGWSLVGWVVALVMSLTSDTPTTVVVNTSFPAAPPPAPGFYRPGYGPPAVYPGQQSPYPPPALPPSTQPTEPTAILPPPPQKDPWARPDQPYRYDQRG